MHTLNLSTSVYGLSRTCENGHAWIYLGVARHTNLALLQTYGQNAWRINNYLLEETAKQSERAVEELKELTMEVNRERKNAQVRTDDIRLDGKLTWVDAVWCAADDAGDEVDGVAVEYIAD